MDGGENGESGSQGVEPRPQTLPLPRRPDLETTVVYYGILGARDGIDPLADVGRIDGSLLGHFGEEDRAIPLEQ